MIPKHDGNLSRVLQDLGGNSIAEKKWQTGVKQGEKKGEDVIKIREDRPNTIVESFTDGTVTRVRTDNRYDSFTGVGN